MQDFPGWMYIYALGSIPVMLFYAAGLSGWFYDYPMPLFVSLTVIFLIPVALLFLKLPNAPVWNVALVWTTAVLLTTRIMHGIVQGDIPIERTEVTMLVSFVAFAVAWAGVWTAYFLKSTRVAALYG